MANLKYILFKDIACRNANNLVWELREIKSPIKILNNNTLVNAKSIIGVLQGRLRFNSEIIVFVEDPTCVENVRKSFNYYGKEV